MSLDGTPDIYRTTLTAHAGTTTFDVFQKDASATASSIPVSPSLVINGESIVAGTMTWTMNDYNRIAYPLAACTFLLPLVTGPLIRWASKPADQ